MHRLIVLVLMAIGITACGQCEDETLVKKTSPHRIWDASVIERNCGATTDYVTRVAITVPDSYFLGPEDVFIVEGQFNVDVEWTPDNELIIHCETCRADDIFVKKDGVYDLKIRYEGISN